MIEAILALETVPQILLFLAVVLGLWQGYLFAIILTALARGVQARVTALPGVLSVVLFIIFILVV